MSITTWVCRGASRAPRLRPSAVRGLLGAIVLLPGLAPRSATALLTCAPRATYLAPGFGSPDDVLVQGKRILFGDIKAGVIGVLSGRKTSVLLRNIAVPEGMALLGNGQLLVMEQATNRLLLINLRTGHRSILLRLTNTTGREGVDGITRVGADILIPDSPNGRLLRLHGGRLQILAAGMSRPTAAVRFRGGFAVADENANAVWLVKGSRLQRLATVPTPDDVVVLRGRLLAVTLGDGALWQITPQPLKLLSGFGQPQGLAATGTESMVIADGTKNALYRVALPNSCFS